MQLIFHNWMLGFILLLIIPWQSVQASQNGENLTAKLALNTPLKVGIYHCPPFIIGATDSALSGLSLELWDNIAANMEAEYELIDYPLGELLQAIQTKQIDIGVSCISITPEREIFADFSHSFYETHLAIAVKKQGYAGTFWSILSHGTLWLVIGGVFAAAALVGTFFYLLEHRENARLYTSKNGIARGFEVFIVGLLFITRGPFNFFEFKSIVARVCSVLMSVITMLFVASITALLASKLTLEQSNAQIKGIGDLATIAVGAKTSTTASQFLTNYGIRHQTFDSMEALLFALEQGEIKAAVADDVVLKYMIGSRENQGLYTHLQVLPYQLEKQNYGFIMLENHPSKEEINRALLHIRESSDWHKTLIDYFAEK
ncbi:substrate-binding periplasmic protein [Vibrio stylophorae]|uniref:substrate-binding periplasmic protein n=1 Tax=Vibrio stylophorae TaxID=659351 RepID=UPI003F4A357C